MSTDHTTYNPREAAPPPPFPEQEQEPPELESEL